MNEDCERQLWSWIHTVLRRAASEWYRQQPTREYVQDPTDEAFAEGGNPLWKTPTVFEDNILTHTLYEQLRTRLSPRERTILAARLAGWSQRDIAQGLHYHPRTLRRDQQHIREVAFQIWRN